MKKVIMLIAMMMVFVSFASAQEKKQIIISSSEKAELMPAVEDALKNIIKRFKGSYQSTTIDHVYGVSDSEILVEGMVRYHTRTCGDVNTDYQVNIRVGDYDTYVYASIYTPYCTNLTGKHKRRYSKWDDRGQKWLLWNDKTKKMVVNTAVKLIIKRFLGV